MDFCLYTKLLMPWRSDLNANFTLTFFLLALRVNFKTYNNFLTLCRISLFLFNTITLTAFLNPLLWLSDKLNSTWTIETSTIRNYTLKQWKYQFLKPFIFQNSISITQTKSFPFLSQSLHCYPQFLEVSDFLNKFFSLEVSKIQDSTVQE